VLLSLGEPLVLVLSEFFVADDHFEQDLLERIFSRDGAPSAPQISSA